MLPMMCPKCSSHELRTAITNNNLADQTMRKRHCISCDHVWYTVELTVPTYAVGWEVKHKRKPVLRVPVELVAGATRLRVTHIEAKDRIELLREANRRKSERSDARHRVTGCDSPDT